MYGDRARIGLIIPSSNAVMEPEFYAIKPHGISVHTSRVILKGLEVETAEDLRRMDEDTENAAELLAYAGVNIIAYGCTTGSMAGGKGWDDQLINRIQQTAKVEVTTTATAVMTALRQLGVGKVSVATPYGEEMDQLEKKFIEDSGIKVMKIKGLGLNSREMWMAPPETTYELATEVNDPESDAIFISCTNFKSITIIERLEKDLGKPVISSNIATMWDLLRRLGINEEIKGYGELLRLVQHA